jgi:hypothetical protein
MPKLQERDDLFSNIKNILAIVENKVGKLNLKIYGSMVQKRLKIDQMNSILPYQNYSKNSIEALMPDGFY